MRLYTDNTNIIPILVALIDMIEIVDKFDNLLHHLSLTQPLPNIAHDQT